MPASLAWCWFLSLSLAKSAGVPSNDPHRSTPIKHTQVIYTHLPVLYYRCYDLVGGEAWLRRRLAWPRQIYHYRMLMHSGGGNYQNYHSQGWARKSGMERVWGTDWKALPVGRGNLRLILQYQIIVLKYEQVARFMMLGYRDASRVQHTFCMMVCKWHLLYQCYSYIIYRNCKKRLTLMMRYGAIDPTLGTVEVSNQTPRGKSESAHNISFSKIEYAW